MNRTFKLLASAAIIGLLLTASHAAEPPLPPHVGFVTTRASQLSPGMTVDDVTRVMGKATRESESAVGSAQIRRLEFADAIPGQVILRDGKVSRVTLDVFQAEQNVPSFLSPAWPGFSSSAVRRASANPQPVMRPNRRYRLTWVLSLRAPANYLRE